MSNIKVQCIDQAIGFLNTPVITSGDVNYDTITFDFCSKWDGFAKTAIFYRTKDEVYYQILDESDSCLIPREVLTEKGTIYIGVFGSKDDVTITSQVLSYKIQEGAITENTKPSDPTPDIYDQLIAKYAEYNSKLDTQIERMNTLEKRMDTGVGDAEKLGGQLPNYYATAQSVADLKNGTTPAGDSKKLNGKSESAIVSHKTNLNTADLSHTNIPAEGGVWLTNASGLAGLPTGWLDARHNLTRLYNGNAGYSLDLLSNYGYQRLAWRMGNKEWKEIIHTGNMNMINGGNADTVDGYHASDFQKVISVAINGNNGETVLDWATNPNGESCKASVTSYGYPSDGIQSEGFYVLQNQTNSRINVFFYPYYNSPKIYKRSIWGGAWKTDWIDITNFLPLTGGKLTGALEVSLDGNGKAQFFGNGATAFMTAVNSAGTVNRQVRVKASGDINSCLDIYDAINKVSYTGLHTGNSSPVVPTNVDPGVGASVTYADGTVIFVYEEE